MIPKIFYFIWFKDKGGRDFGYTHYLSVLTNIKVNKPTHAILISNKSYEHDLMNNVYILDLLYLHPDIFEIDFISDERIEYATDGKYIPYQAHRSDTIRLKKLYSTGGVYVDLDCYPIRPLPNEWYESNTVKWGIESDGSETALCNNVIVAPAGNKFIKSCLDLYENEYDPEIAKPGSMEWAKYSVMRPYEIYKENKYGEYTNLQEAVDILPSGTFQPFHQSYSDTEKLFFLDRMNKLKDSQYMLHTWETRNWNILKNLSFSYILESNATFAQVVRDALY